MNRFRPLACAALLALCLPVAAQQSPAPKAEPAKAPEPDIAVLRAMKSKLFVLQHRDSLQLMRSVSALGSGANGSTMKFNNENGLNTLAVRDFPENLAAIEEAIKRLDVATSVRTNPDVELHIHVLLASKQVSSSASLPKELDEVVLSLKDTLSYKSYALAASFVQRLQMTERHIEGEGLLDSKTYGSDTAKDTSMFQVSWWSQGGALDMPNDGPAQIRLRDFDLTLAEKTGTGLQTLARIRSDLAFKEGEKVVVGTSVVKDKGLIVVLTARLVK